MRTASHYFWAGANLYGRLFGRPWLSPAHRIIANLALHGLGYDNALRPSYTGESWFIRTVLRKAHVRLALDVGANVGRYSSELVGALGCRVYAFEPALACASKLAEAERKADGKLIVARTAVADFDGTARLFSPVPGAETATLDASRGIADGEEVPVTRLDTFARERGIGGVDLVKVDVEGYEREALLGMQDLLKTERPAYVQFEFNVYHLKRGHTLLSLTALLPGYRFYRLLPTGWLLIDPAKAVNNVFMFSNIVAERLDIAP